MIRALFIGGFFLLTSCAQIQQFKEWSGLEKPQRMAQSFQAKWIKRFDPPFVSGNHSINLRGVLAVQDRVYLGADKGFYALSAKTGRVYWSADQEKKLSGTPTYYDNMILYTTESGDLVARDDLTGEEKYRAQIGMGSDTKGVIAQDRLLLHLRNYHFLCIDPSTGEILWNYQRVVPYETTLQRVSAPTVVGNKVLVGFADGVVVALSLEEGAPIWERKVSNGSKFVDVDITPLVDGQNVLVGGGEAPATLLSLQDGQVIKRFPFTLSASALKAEGYVFAPTTAGEVVVLDASYGEIHRIKDSQMPISSLAYWKGDLVVASHDGRIQSYKIQKGFSHKGEFELGTKVSTIYGELVTREDELYVYSSRYRLYRF